MNRTRTLLIALASLGLVVGFSGPVNAKSAPKPVKDEVKISSISGPTASYKGTATVKPKVTSTGRVVIDDSSITASTKAGIVADHVPSASLAAGKYTVRTDVAYRTYVDVERTRPTSYVVSDYLAGDHPGSACTITSTTDIGPVDIRVDRYTGTAICNTPETSAGTSAGYSIDISILPEFGNSSYGGALPIVGWKILRGTYGETQLSSESVVVHTMNESGTKLNGVAFVSPFAIDFDVSHTEYQSPTYTERQFSAPLALSKSQSLTVKAGKKPTCATVEDYDSVDAIDDGWGDSYVGDPTKVVQEKLFSSGKLRYTVQIDDGPKLKGYEFKTCEKKKLITIEIFDGHAVNKSYLDGHKY